MKKFLVLALMAALALTGSAFAREQQWAAVPNATFAFGAPATTDNADSCDIGVTPAATLLLPYFEVETATRGTDTLFTIVNTSRFPQIAHVTLWTDWSSPVLDFNVFLTGYDVQGLSLYDIIVNGVIAPPSGTSSTTTIGVAGANTGGIGAPALNTANPRLTTTACAGLPGTLPTDVVAAVRGALTTGANAAFCGGDQIGGNHGTRAIGYATVDVVATCNTLLPTDPAYYGPTGLLYDNVLTGDYQQVGPSPAGSAGTGFDAGGTELVHIRAIPEGGPAGVVVPTNLPWTFYNRYNSSDSNRRQPLPSTWAARWINGGTAGLSTDFKIWREGITGGGAGAGGGCDVAANSALAVTGIVRFDEAENSFGFGSNPICSPLCGPGGVPPLPETSRTNVATTNFPPLPGSSTAVGGWMYLNLSNGGQSVSVPGQPNAMTEFAGTAARTTSQNWVIDSLFGNIGNARLSVDFNATWLANGCTFAPAATTAIGPNNTNTQGNLVCQPLAEATCPTGTIVPTTNP